MTRQEIKDYIVENMPEVNGAQEFVEDYTGYICDAISELADNQVDIYDSELIKWAGEGNVEYVNDAISEFGWDGCGSDFIKAIQMGQFLYYERDLYDHLDTLILLDALQYVCSNYENLDIDEELDINDFVSEIEDRVSIIDNNDTFDDIEEKVDEYFEELAEEKEEELEEGEVK